MSFWKQLALSLVVIVVAAGLWLSFFPGAPETLDRWGLGWAAAALPNRTVETPATPSRQGAGTPGGGFGQPGLVVAADIGTATINDRLVAIGTGKALNSVAVTPFASGRLTEILATSGEQVEAGEVIARLDSETEEIAVDRARIALADAEARLERVKALRSSNTATAVQLTEAELSVSNAQLAVRDAELTLSRRSIVSPIDGIIGILPVSIGNAVTTQTEIATIDDRSQLVVDFWVAERFAGMISIGQPVTAVSVARPDETHHGSVSAVDNRIDPQSRTLHIQARIANDDERLRAGMAFEVTMQFPGDSYPAVDPLAIQWGTDGAYIWALDRDGMARRIGVRIIQRNTDSVLITGDFGDATRVVTEGVHAVRDGAPVRVVGDTQLDGQPQAAVSTTGS